jgi:ribosomal protein S25
MANLDAFTAQIVTLVRSMPDEAILELVRNQLGLVSSMGDIAPWAAVKVPAPAKRSRARKAVARKAAPKRAAKKAAPRKAAPRKAAPRKSRPPASRTSEERSKTLEGVEKAVKAAKGLSVSELVKRTGLPPSRVSSALRELKGAKRIFQGGDRRFARYAGDARTAQQASEQARTTAPGPIRKNQGKAAKKAKARRK